MTRIEKTNYGFKLIFSGVVNIDQITNWLDESKKVLPDKPEDFHVFVDMRDLQPISIMVQKIFDEGQQLYKEKGMIRSVVILNSPIVKRQFEQIAKLSGIYEWERYIDASHTPEWDEKGLEWLIHGSDPNSELVDESGINVIHTSNY